MTPDLNRKTYSMGSTQETRDTEDGERDALRVLAGLEPMRHRNAPVTPAYRAAWEAAAATALGAIAS